MRDRRSGKGMPPLRDRITWREGIHPETLISQDRGLIARSYGTAFSTGGILGFLVLAVGQETDRVDAAIAVMSGLALILGAISFVVYSRLPMWFFQGVVFLGTLMVTAAIGFGSTGAEGVYGLLYIWIVVTACLFFEWRLAAVQSLFAATCYGVILFARDAPFATNLLLVAIGTIGGVSAVVGFIRLRMEQIAAGLAAVARTDPVTAIGNRRDFDVKLEQEVARSQATGRPLSLVICDLDRFKRVNDELGHEEGDVALRKAATAIGNSVRTVDAVARLGGEEFAVLLPDTDLDMATAVAERVRTGIRAEFRGYEVALTVSCGLACSTDVGAEAQQLFRAADAALYTAKHRGRDRTVSSSAVA